MALHRVFSRGLWATRTLPSLPNTAFPCTSARYFAASGKPTKRGARAEIDEDAADENMLMGSLVGNKKLDGLDDQFETLAGDLDVMSGDKPRAPRTTRTAVPPASAVTPATPKQESSLSEVQSEESAEHLSEEEDAWKFQKKEERKKHIMVEADERVVIISKAPLTLFSSDVKNFLAPEVETHDIVQEVALGLKPTGVWLAKVGVDDAGKAVRKNRGNIGPLPVDVARTSVRVWKDATSVIVQIPERMRAVVVANIPHSVTAFALRNSLGSDVDCRLIRLQTPPGSNKVFLVKCRTVYDAQFVMLKLGGWEVAPGTKLMATLLA